MIKDKIRMKIAIIAPPFISIPPQGQGGTERIIYQMCEEMTKRGHDVTLFGAGECHISGRFEQIFKETISERKFNSRVVEGSRPLRLETAYMAKVMTKISRREREFDIIFSHMRGGYIFLLQVQYLKTPIVHILHLPIFAEMAEVFSLYKEPNIITISNSQRKFAPYLNYLATVYNGVDVGEFEFNPKPKDYLLYMGALGEHKNPRAAINVTKKTGQKLILAGGKIRHPYFEEEIEPLIDGKQIQYVGEVKGQKRVDILKNAKAFLFPIVWPEPFGLAMIEAMASGTPAIAFNHGAVREVIENGKTGFIVGNEAEMAKAVNKIDQIERKACRIRVEKHFTTQRMVDDYLEVAEKLIVK